MDLVEDALLALAEGDLVGDLVEVARRPAPLAVQAADREVDLLQGPEDLFDLLVNSSAGRCSITLARIPVPTLVGQAVR